MRLARVSLKLGLRAGAQFKKPVPQQEKEIFGFDTRRRLCSFNTALLRSRRSAPSGVVLRRSSILTLRAYPAAVRKASMSVLVLLSLCTQAPSNGTGGGGGNGSICVIGLSTVHLPSTILRGTPVASSRFFVPPVFLFLPPDFPRSEYTFCRP